MISMDAPWPTLTLQGSPTPSTRLGPAVGPGWVSCNNPAAAQGPGLSKLWPERSWPRGRGVLGVILGARQGPISQTSGVLQTASLVGTCSGKGTGTPSGAELRPGPAAGAGSAAPREPGPAGGSPLGWPPVAPRAAARRGTGGGVWCLRMGLSPQQQRQREGTWGSPGTQEGQPGEQQGMAGAEPRGTRRGGPVLPLPPLPPRPAPSRRGGSGGARGSAVPSRAEPGLLQGPPGAGSWAGPCLGTAEPSAAALALRAGRGGRARIRLPAGSILSAAAAPVALGCSQQPPQTRGEGREPVCADCPWRVMGQQVERSQRSE